MGEWADRVMLIVGSATDGTYGTHETNVSTDELLAPPTLAPHRVAHSLAVSLYSPENML